MRWPHWHRITSLEPCCCQWVSKLPKTPAPPWRAACSIRLSQASKSGVWRLASAVARRRTSALCSNSTNSFFLHHLSDRQIAQLLTHSHQLIDDVFKLTHGLNLLTIQGNQGGITQAHRNGLVGLLSCQERIGAALDAGAIGVFDRQKLFNQRATPQLAQAGEPLQECLTLLFQVRAIGKGLFNIVVIILQLERQKQAKTLEPTFISSTRTSARP